MYQLTFEVQDLPDMPNRLLGASWRVRVGHAKKWERVVWKHTWAIKPRQPLTRASLTLTRYSSQRPDHDGLVGSFKAVIDGLVKNGVLLDDDHAVIGVPKYLWEPASPRKGKIKIEVKELTTKELSNEQEQDRP